MQTEDVEIVARLVPAGQGQKLVGGKVDVMQHESHQLVALSGHEPPGRIVRPFHLGSIVAARHRGTNEARQTQPDSHGVARAVELDHVGSKSLSDALYRVLEIVEVVAVAGSVGFQVKRRSTRQVTVERAVR